MNNLQLRLAIVGGAIAALLFFVFLSFDLVTVRGNQVGVRETWTGGVDIDPLPPRTYLCWPWERIQVYETSTQVFVMNDRPDNKEVNSGRLEDTYLVQSSDSQDMHLSLMVQWRIDPKEVVTIHKTVGPEMIEEKILRPTMLRVVKDSATQKKAIDAYSGQGLVSLQQEIERNLNDPNGELRQRGLIIDSFVIEHIKLDPEYVKEITARQVAIQRELRAVQEEKAAQAEALKAKAVALADLNKAVVQAERDKQVQVLAAEASNEQEILKAEAEKKKTVLAAEARKESGELEAASILAIGTANAEAEKLKFSAYSVPGAELYARIEVAKSLGAAFGNIKGYLPENMQVYTLGENFLQAIESIVGEKQGARQ